MKLHTNNLSYKSILNNINISFLENGINYISGSNKCGKTTLIKILCGLIDIKDAVFYGKKDIYDFSSYKLSTEFGYVLNDMKFTYLFSNVEQELQYRLNKLGIDQKEKKKRYTEMIKLFDLGNVLNKNIDKLSYVSRLKLSLAISLLSIPKILFLDDIFSNIDFNTSKEILLKLKSIKDLTVIMAVNNLELSIISDKVIILNKGEVLLDGPAFEVLKKDSLLNKIGLELPFEVDLCNKLKYYNLLSDIELDMDRMVNKLWN